ncbi:MAG: P-type conjugative transfer protein TrbL [Rhodospirillaceae bacterium]|nr:P-type conjugative transfer protein TrbL [Rhodospirillaceae bacterium]
MNFNDATVIDQFLSTFIHYIDSGFGLLDGDVAHLTAFLIAIDITLVGLMWALDTNGDVIPRLIKKVLYVGLFAFIINNFSFLADTIFRSFAALGINVGNNGVSAADLLRPGRLAGLGFETAYPFLEKASDMIGFTNFFSNIIIVVILLFAWFVVVLAFFILAVQLFITILEFKLTTLAGFILVPFALWNKSSFLAERVLGNVISSGIKVMVLAVIVGIGATFFDDFSAALNNGQDVTVNQAMSLVLGAITLFGIGIFGPAIASGLVTGAPQLGAGAAIGTAAGVVGATALTAGALKAGGQALVGGAAGAIRAATSLGAGASAAYRLGQASSGSTGMAGVGAGLAGVGKAGAGAVGQKLLGSVRSVGQTLAAGVQAGTRGAWKATGGEGPKGAAATGAYPTGAQSAPDWAKSLRSEQRMRARTHAATQSIKEGDKGGGSANPDLSDKE